MKFNKVEGMNIVTIENVFGKEEEAMIWQELDNYSQKNIFLSPEQTGSATNKNGSLKKKNSAVFLDNLYTSQGRKTSSILEFTEKNLLSIDTKKKIQKEDNIFGMLFKANTHFTLVNYYENSDYYDFHDDDAMFSILTYIFKEPKNFNGGNIIFKDRKDGEEFEIEIKNNMSVFFPSFYQHKVVPIQMKTKDQGKNLGRFSIAQFIFVNSNI